MVYEWICLDEYVANKKLLVLNSANNRELNHVNNNGRTPLLPVAMVYDVAICMYVCMYIKIYIPHFLI